jgi:eukaryotic-like serine/threonine-protein kinase
MNALQWERAKDIFDAALDLPLEARSSYLESACESDPILRTEVEQLLDADERAGTFLDTSWLPPAMNLFNLPPDVSLRAGDIICDRYRIVRALGDGGMGQVYEAFDSELGVQIALKVLRPEIAANPEVLARFRQEVRIALRITHPNVCRTFHLDRAIRPEGPYDLIFITMEFLDGETLQQNLKSTGRLSPVRALAIARQMAQGIEAAHRTGIIHRDIKPGNVMICPATSGNLEADRVVVTDFGLAKFGPTAATNKDLSSISHPGRAMGTLAYMSPEQLEAGEAGPATDIYAFGLVLFEMVTGQKAFPDSGTLAVAFRRLSEDPPSAKALLPDLPAEWETAISGCLRIDPATRFRHALDVIAVLDGGDLAQLPAFAHRARKSKHRPSALPRGRKLFALVGALIGCVALFWYGSRFYSSRADSTVAAGTLVYLAPVKNETGEKQLDNVTELVQAGLSQSAHVNLLDAGRVDDILQRMTKPADTPITPAIAREIAMHVGAPRVILTSVTGSHGSYQFNVDIQQPDPNDLSRPRKHWPKRFDWTNDSATVSGTVSPQLANALRDANDWIRLRVGESEKDILKLDSSPEDATTDNWEALADYSSAEQFASAHRRNDAVLSLQNAVLLDGHFALAYARLGDILFSLNRSVEGLNAYIKALDAGSERRLSRRERDRIRGLYALDTWDYQTAESVFHDSTIYYEHDWLGWFYHGSALMMLNQTPQGVESMKQAAKLNPSASSVWYTLGSFFYQTHNEAGAEQTVASLRQYGHEGEALWLEAEGAYLAGRLDEADQKLKAGEMLNSSSVASASFTQRAHIAAERGKPLRAIEILTDGMARDESNGQIAERAQKIMDRAYLNCKLRRYSECFDDEREALRVNPGPKMYRAATALLSDSLPVVPPSVTTEIVRMLKQNERSMPHGNLGPVSEIVEAEIQGTILQHEGKQAASLRQFRKAATIDAPSELNPNLIHALLRAATEEQNSGKKQALLNEASTYYARIAQQQAFIWYHTTYYPPGFYADSLESWLKLSPPLTGDDITQKLSHLRSNALESASRPQQHRFNN